MTHRFNKLAAVLTLTALTVACGERPPVDSEQIGFRGTAMGTVTNPRIAQADMTVPDALPPASDAGPRAGEIYQNVEVLGDLSIAQFTR
ncbi:MAG: photosynthetic reaction center cytochrome c subunit family protein, partial [Pseudomonadota bacterium]